MTGQHDRRRFLRNSLAAGAAVTLAAGDSPLGSEPSRSSPPGAGGLRPRSGRDLAEWEPLAADT